MHPTMSVQGEPVPKLLQEEQIASMVFDTIKSNLAAQVQSSLVEVQMSVEALARRVGMLELVV